jgi:hypothetical protein
VANVFDKSESKIDIVILAFDPTFSSILAFNKSALISDKFKLSKVLL